MSDPNAARTGGTGKDPDTRRPRPRFPTLSWPAAVAAARTVLITVALVTAYYVLPLDERDTTASFLLVVGLLVTLLVFLWEVRAIARSPHPRMRAVEALSATVVLFLVLFAGTYYLIDSSTPGSFTEEMTRTDALYFTLATFSTVGFGDITASSETARVVTMLQMVVGLLLVGVAARVLASAVETGLRRQAHTPSDAPRPDTAP
ncbi:potassium channel family protein [Streptomyces chumphonensis]|uniref:Two pore domain potassium channel family protein n=1 Tax=Streptomyces chumphonensis TaxID=1214925 RepID=A0A927F0D4_9ACTN|nr:potassium channel family protein [Streptomyces chumphonensis]MBD3933294.1 two pore domain potassium channel family protein [Streptomyces chumphonensis]